MGLGQSKEKKFDENLEAVDLLDIIATKYILTQNFQDMKKLGQKEYCDKLVILTSDIIKKFMNKREIEYLARRVERGDYYNRLEKKKVMYLDTNELGSKSKQRFSKKELEDFEKKEQEQLGKHLAKEYKRRQDKVRDYDYGYDDLYVGGNKKIKGGNMLTDMLYGRSDLPRRRLPLPRRRLPPRNKKTLLSELDIRDKDQKDRMCKGIAKFYITIAHLYAAIVKTINPVYVYDKDGKRHALSIQNRDKIPKGVIPRLTEINLCSKRVNAIKPTEVEGMIGVLI